MIAFLISFVLFYCITMSSDIEAARGIVRTNCVFVAGEIHCPTPRLFYSTNHKMMFPRQCVSVRTLAKPDPYLPSHTICSPKPRAKVSNRGGGRTYFLVISEVAKPSTCPSLCRSGWKPMPLITRVFAHSFASYTRGSHTRKNAEKGMAHLCHHSHADDLSPRPDTVCLHTFVALQSTRQGE